jgi:hypothetical protein
MGNADTPVLISHPETIVPNLDTATTLYIGGIWGTVKSGQTWIASDGKRFVWSADGLQVVYSVNGKFFAQGSQGFINEVRTQPFIAGVSSAEPLVRLAQIEVNFLMGLLAGASTVGFIIVVGTEAAEFVIENRDEFSTWYHQLEAVLKARALLKAHAPVLYDKVFNAVLKQVYKDVKGNIPDAVTPEVVFFGVGVIVGSVGKKITKGKFTVLALVVVVLEQLFVRLTLGVVPKAIKITEAEYRKMADEIIAQLRSAGVAIHDGDIHAIVKEVQQHPVEVKKALDMMHDAFEERAAAVKGR